jgi:hypothetical protein
MRGTRILQLVVHFVLIIFCAVSVPGFTKNDPDGRDMLLVIILVVAMITLTASVKLNWLILKPQKLFIKLPPTSALQFVLISLSLIIISLAGRLYFLYDDHLSSYDLYADISDLPWRPEQLWRFEQLGIVRSRFGIFLFVFYVFIFMLIAGMHTLGWFSYNRIQHGVFSRLLLCLQIVVGSMLIAIVLFLVYHFALSVFAFLEQVQLDGELWNTWSIGVMFFDCLNLIFLFGYSIWVLSDGIKLWRIRGTGSMMPPEQLY